MSSLLVPFLETLLYLITHRIKSACLRSVTQDLSVPTLAPLHPGADTKVAPQGGTTLLLT